MSKIDFYHGQGPTGTYVGFLFSYGRVYERLPTASICREVQKVVAFIT